jgi:predicted RNA methylase
MGLQHVVVHGDMVLDDARNVALAKSIDEVVRPGDVVADVGAGTGLLAILAARAGASHVYAVERGPMADVARVLVRRNGFDGVVEVVAADSRAFAPSHPVDVVLCETLGMAVLDEGFRTTMADARDRLLRPGGRLVPAAVDVLVAPVRRVPAAVALDDLDTVLGLDLSPFADVVRGVHRRVHVDDADLLAAPVVAFSLDCATMAPDDELSATVTFDAPVDPADLGGFVVWFEARLSPTVVLTNRGTGPRNHWGQALLPVRPPAFPVSAVRLAMDDGPGRFRVRWQAITQEAQ